MTSKLKIKQYLVCHTDISLQTHQVLCNNYSSKTYYSLYYQRCGYGLNNSYDSCIEAVNHWNETALITR